MRRLFLPTLFLLFLNLLNAQNQTVTYNYCDDDLDGFLSFNLTQIGAEIIEQVSFSDTSDVERILISTSNGSVYIIHTPSTNPTLELICQYHSIGFSDIAVDVNKDVYTSDFGRIYSKENNLCNYTELLNFEFGTNVNALSFDIANNMYFGMDSESNVYRYDVSDTLPPYVWHDFGTGSSGGDFVMLNDKMYIAWKLSNDNFRLFEVTVDSSFNYVSHIDIGQLPDNTYGLASELGKLYGVKTDELFEINLENFTFTTIIQNDGANGDWGGASGYHEAIQYDVTSHISEADANSGSNPLPEEWVNTVSGGQTIYIRVENIITGEYIVVDVILNIYLLPQTNKPDDLILCTENNALGLFDLTQVEDQLLENVTQTINITYYRDLYEAQTNQNTISETYQAYTEIQPIFVRTENLSTNCFTIEEFSIISNQKPLFASLSVAPDFRFLNNCYEDCEGVKYFNLDEAYQLVVLDEEPLVLEFYSTSEDAENGINQMPTIHIASNGLQEEIFVKAYNEYDCYSITNFFIDGNCVVRSLNVGCFIFPQFFTPNEDGENDNWNVSGLSDKIQRESTVDIFDRYGKHLYSFKPLDNSGWDGTFKNNKLPSTDYWYIFKTNSGYQYAGHFSLIRQ